MRVADLDPDALGERLARGRLTLHTGPFVNRIESPLARVAEGLRQLYADYPCDDADGFADFHVRVAPPAGLRRWFRPQVCFEFDGREPFRRMVADQAFAMLEWGLNWCVYSHAHQYLMIHAAVAARGDQAVLLPAPPGSGKSTLCAGLVCAGWRLLSDEMALIRLDDGLLVPMPRPVGLKNESIEVIRAFEPEAVISRPVLDTIKGTVAHMKVPTESIARRAEHAHPAWVIFPRFVAGAGFALEPRAKGRAFMQIADNAFNYSTLGELGFDVLGRMIEACDCFDLSYGDLDEAVARLEALPAPRGGASPPP